MCGCFIAFDSPIRHGFDFTPSTSIFVRCDDEALEIQFHRCPLKQAWEGHGITGDERLVLYDRGDGVGAMPAAQMAELAGHPRVAVLLGGLAAWPGEPEIGQVELHPVKTTFEPSLDAVPTREELVQRLDDPTLTILDVRTAEEFSGKRGYPCDPRQGRIPGARHVHVQDLFVASGEPLPGDHIRARIGDADEIVAYCHSGSRSALATLALRAAGFRARNYAGSWHEWSRHDELPMERG